jgi:hypothetical protein
VHLTERKQYDRVDYNHFSKDYREITHFHDSRSEVLSSLPDINIETLSTKDTCHKGTANAFQDPRNTDDYFESVYGVNSDGQTNDIALDISMDCKRSSNSGNSNFLEHLQKPGLQTEIQSYGHLNSFDMNSCVCPSTFFSDIIGLESAKSTDVSHQSTDEGNGTLCTPPKIRSSEQTSSQRDSCSFDDTTSSARSCDLGYENESAENVENLFHSRSEIKLCNDTQKKVLLQKACEKVA